MLSKQEKINSFNPNDVGAAGANIFGLPFTLDESEIVIIPIPWEVTVSYGGGTANGPLGVFEASFQVDLLDPVIPDAWKNGFAMDEENKEIRKKSDSLRPLAEEYIALLCKGENCDTNATMQQIKNEVNAGSLWLNEVVKERVLYFLKQNKVVGLLGGDHSTPLGMMQALAQHFGDFGILQIDAHADLRESYEGFEFSHASIMFNGLKIKEVTKLIQVGIRDYCESEFEIIKNSKGRVKTFFDRDIKHAQFEGETWANICTQIVNELPENIYLSFDIDGLDPKLCPNTGTPVSGGFETEEILYLIEKIMKSGKKIIAFDINEISPGADEWDANVGARMLYRIANMVNQTNKK